MGESRIILDFSAVRCPEDVHRMLKKAFGLPDYYGKNWDALWDCLDGWFLDRESCVVELRAFYAMDSELQDYCAPMMEIFRDVQADTPNVRFVLVS